MICNRSLDDLLNKVWSGERIDRDEGLQLYTLPLEELGALANRRRELAKKNAYNGCGNQIVTYIIDRNINYTNVCNVYCKFCAFYRVEKDDDAYVISHAEMDRKIEETIALGGTQILMQGGHHPKLSKQWYLDLLSHIKAKFPQINIHGFSPSEFVHFREVFNEPVETIIRDFVKAGLGSIPGGGGEILVDRVRQRISPLKAMSDEWLGVMDTAHRLGLASTATMMFGHVETLEDRIEHLERVRAQQDKSQRAASILLAKDAATDGMSTDLLSFDSLNCPSPAGCWRRVHRIHRVDFPVGKHEAQSPDRRRARILADAGAQPHLPRQHSEHSKLVGHARTRHRPDRAQVRSE
jgi:cyclic dehypoxanthinyl futalosine synthase